LGEEIRILVKLVQKHAQPLDILFQKMRKVTTAVFAVFQVEFLAVGEA
jgi:hypothetical protein